MTGGSELGYTSETRRQGQSVERTRTRTEAAAGFRGESTS